MKNSQIEIPSDPRGIIMLCKATILNLGSDQKLLKSEAYHQMGAAHNALGTFEDKKKELECYNEALKLNPNHYKCAYDKGNVLMIKV